VAVAPLRVDAPGMRAVVEESKVLLAGRAAKGSTVTVDGASVPVGIDGFFEAVVALDAPGEHSVEVRASTANLVPRSVHALITRVTSLADASRQFEQQHPIGYDAAMSDAAGKAGQPIVVVGDVLEVRSSRHQTIVIVDDKRGCVRGPCVVRVIVGREVVLARGDVIRAYGVVARAISAPAGQTALEVEAQFVVPAKR
jgi:hypothetical protein